MNNTQPKKNVKQPRTSCRTKGGSVLADMSKLAVPFGLIAAKNSLEKFISNRDAEMKKNNLTSKPTKKTKTKTKAKAKAKA